MKVMGGLQSERNQEEKESDDESDIQNYRRCSCWAKLKLTKSSRKIPNHKENYEEWRSVCKRIIYVHMIFQTLLSLHQLSHEIQETKVTDDSIPSPQ